MTEFLVEVYVSKTNSAAVARTAVRLTRAAQELTAKGTPVRLLRTIFVPEDETCYLLVEAATAGIVRESARRAALLSERVVEAAADLTISKGGEIT